MSPKAPVEESSLEGSVELPVLHGAKALPKPSEDRAANCVAGTKRTSSLDKLAFASLWLLVFVIPWENVLLIPGFGTGTRLIGIVTLGVGILGIIARGRIRRPSPGHIIMSLFVMWAAASYLWSIAPEMTLLKAFQYCQLFMMVWLIWEFSSRTQAQKQLLLAYVLGTCVSGIDTVYQFLSHHESGYLRYAGAGLNADDLGLIMALSIPVSYYLLLQSERGSAWVYRLQFALAAITIFLCAARGSFLAALVALSIVPLTYGHLRRRQKITMFLTLALLLGGGFFFVPASSWQRISTIPQELTHGTLTGRTVVWIAGWEVFRDHPFVGVGAGAYGYSVMHIFPEWQTVTPGGPYAHNTFLSVLVEQGVVGLVLFCALVGLLALSAKEMPYLPRNLWIVTLGVWLIGVSSLSWEMQKATWFFFGMLMVQHASMNSRRRAVNGGHLVAPPLSLRDKLLLLRPLEM
jgi:O-antigen ligase